jgi:hypothetical protein
MEGILSRQTNIFLAVFLANYCILTIPLIMWPSSGVIAMLAFVLYALLSVSIAAQMTELLLAIWWRAPRFQQTEGTPPRHKVAVLMVACDDADSGHLESLRPLGSAGYDVFLLDDSVVPVSLPEALRKKMLHVRRDSRRGAKAGNLNDWLWSQGAAYTYALILDADSKVSADCADQLLRVAEHPANEQIALFQSKLMPSTNTDWLFNRALCTVARPRARILERVHQPLGLTLSAGHNLLARLAPIRALGGFNERFTNEDTALSLECVGAGWKIALVDAWSEDGDPKTIASYNRRTVRWARQTVELFGGRWTPTPLRLKLLICRHFFDYLSPLLGMALLCISIWSGPKRAADSIVFMTAALSMQPGYAYYGLTMWVIISIFGMHLGLRSLLASLEGISWSDQLLGLALGSAHYATLVTPLALGVGASIVGHSVPFVPTNSHLARRQEENRWARLRRALNSLPICALLLLGALRHPGSVLLGLNIVWIFCFLLSPVALIVSNHAQTHLRGKWARFGGGR